MAGRPQRSDAMTERGRLLKAIREDRLGVSQYEMADLLNAKATELGLPAAYLNYHVSRNERGTISFEDAAVWLAVDPDANVHGWDWFVHCGNMKPEPPTGATTDPEDSPYGLPPEQLQEDDRTTRRTGPTGDQKTRARKGKPVHDPEDTPPQEEG